MMTGFSHEKRSIEELEGDRWPEPPGDATPLARAVYELRRRPVDTLNAMELSRLLGQNVGTVHLLESAISILEYQVYDEPDSEWFEEDLLAALLHLDHSIWRRNPSMALRLRTAVLGIFDVSSHLEADISSFMNETRLLEL